MNTAHVDHRIRLDALGFEASIRGNDTDGYTVEADVAQATLGAAVAAAPADDDAANADALRQRAVAALTANANYLALASPTQAQAIAQVDRLTRECSALIRLMLGALDSTAGT